MKKFLVRLRKIRRMFFLSEVEFDVEYLKRRIRDISEEVNLMPLKERLKFVSEIREQVIKNLIKEQAVAKLKYEAIREILKENEK